MADLQSVKPKNLCL